MLRCPASASRAERSPSGTTLSSGLFCRDLAANNSPVLVFNRIFNFDQAAVARMEQRLNTRYVPGAAFPLQAWLIVAGTEIPAKVKDISGNGISLLLEPGAELAKDAVGQVRLRFGAHQQLVGGRVVHLHAEGDRTQCGLGLTFADFAARKTYLQLLQPIAIGQSLQAVPADQVAQDEPQFTKQVYRGDENSTLTVWLERTADTPLQGFEFQMRDYCCHADGPAGVLETYKREAADAAKNKLTHPVFDMSGTLQAEIRQLFRWTLPNLSPAVPDDVRAFLQRFAR